MMDRRTVLRSAGGVACLLAGCTTSPANEQAHHVTVRNLTGTDRTLGVIVDGESGTVFNHRYDLDPATDQEGYGFYGEATAITAVLDGDVEFQFDFANARCSGRKLVGLVLTVTGADDVDLGYECAGTSDPTASNGDATRL